MNYEVVTQTQHTHTHMYTHVQYIQYTLVCIYTRIYILVYISLYISVYNVHTVLFLSKFVGIFNLTAYSSQLQEVARMGGECSIPQSQIQNSKR